MTAAELVADDRGAERDRVGIIDFAEELAAAIKVIGIRKIDLPVIALLPVEDAVGTDVDQAGPSHLAEPRQPVRQYSIERDRHQRIGRASKLLHNTDAVDDDVRLD